MEVTTPNVKGGAGCLVVFGAIFVIAGMVPGYFAVSSLWEWVQARDWAPVPAQILEANIEYGEDTQRAIARYRYEYGGHRYEGSRVSFYGGSDNIGDFHYDSYRLLSDHQNSGKPFTIYVDPDNPAESVARRDLRPGLLAFMMLFPLVFGGAGSGVIAFAIYSSRSQRGQQKREDDHPDEPWRWNPEWDSPVLKDGGNKLLIFAIAFASLWNLISAPIPFLIWEEVTDKGNTAALFALLFPLVGLGLIAWVVWLLMQRRRYGNATFTLDSLPVALGGQLSGKLHIPTKLAEGDLLNVHLDCVRRRITGSGKHRSTDEDLLWQDSQRLRLQPHHLMQGTRVHIAFPVPEDQPQTDGRNPRDAIVWRLRMSAETPGVDFSAAFEIPVFQTALSADTVTAPVEHLFSDAAEPADWRHTGAEVRYGSDGMEYYVPPARHRGLASTLTLMAVVFGAVAAFLWSESEIFMAAIFGLAALLLAWAASHMWLIRSRMVPASGRLRFHRGYRDAGSLRELPAHRIRAFEIKPGVRSGNTQYYTLIASTTDGGKVKLADLLEGRRDTENLARILSEAVGI